VPQPEHQYNGSPCQNINDKVDDDGSVPKFNLTYRFTDNKLMYVTYSEGFRPGGINRNNTVPPYKPDYLKNYELGWKTTWLDNTLRFNGAIFHEDWTDIPVLVPATERLRPHRDPQRGLRHDRRSRG
jgi:outer membrane receptor protein involved in Fe transport